jgi:two-component system, cell cycle sensor histidine kinase and response regulator CckA
LGLSTVYGIVRQSSGFIQVRSEMGKGTAFTIYIPQAASEAYHADGSLKDDIDRSGSETILLVEDDAAVRELIAKVLSDRGYRLLDAANGKEALRIAQEFSGEIHLILTDIVMPEMSGMELVSRIAQARPAARALFVSGYIGEAIDQAGLNPTIAILTKPFTPVSLLRKVREVIDGERRV